MMMRPSAVSATLQAIGTVAVDTQMRRGTMWSVHTWASMRRTEPAEWAMIRSRSAASMTAGVIGGGPPDAGAAQPVMSAS